MSERPTGEPSGKSMRKKATPVSAAVPGSPMNRRALLGRAAVVGAGLAVAACAPAANVIASLSPSPSPIPSPTVRKPVSITFWYWADSPVIGTFFKTTIDNFNNSQKFVTVVAEVLPNTETGRQKLVATAVAGGGGPDVSYANIAFLQPMYDAGIIQPVQDYFDKWSGKSDVPSDMVNVHRIKQEQPLLAMPIAVSAGMHYYRSDVYKAAGLKAPETFEQLVSNARALNDPPRRYGFGLRGIDANGFLFNFVNYLIGAGVTLTDNKGGTDLDSSATIDFATGLLELYWQGIAQPSALQDAFAQMVAQFQSGKVAQWSAYLHHDVLLTGADKKFDDVVGATAWPLSAGKKGHVDVQSAAFIMLKASQQKDAAWEFIAALNEPSVVLDYYKISGFLPVRSSVVQRPEVQADRFVQIATKSAPVLQAYPYSHKNWTAFSNTNGPQLWQRALQKDLAVKDLMGQLATLMRQV